ncbi:MAG: type IV pilus twitching motility protein PilT, partial [Desulfobacterales bacterium]
MAAIDQYFREMQANGASDLHMVVGFPPLIRLKGELAALDHPPLTAESNEQILFEILNDEQRASVQNDLDFDMAYELEGVGRFRCNMFYQHRGIGAVFRIIPTEILTLEQLNLPEILKAIACYTKGLVLVTGPTGSGKSTTLAAMIDHINDSMCRHIITIEDPIEFVHPDKQSLVVHREVGEHSDSFANALRGAKRADPDIILVGEMRELETIRLALGCASMGMLVFGTLHTNSAAKTIDRIIDVFPADEQSQIRTMLAECLTAVVSQLLCHTADGKG